jgi:glycosyltransferase involved in cell wall biosynthesis
MSISGQKLVSVCIVTYRRDETLMESLQQLLRSTVQPDEILIVDNGPSEMLPQLLKGFPVPVELIYPEGNVGCAGLNLAFAKAKGRFLFCFDDDSFPDPDCMARAIAAFEADPTLGMIGFNMHDPETRTPWHDPWWNPETPEIRETIFCPGCGVAFRRDPRLPEEICIPDLISQGHELSMAAEILRLGLRIERHPECVAYHPDTTKGYTGEKARVGNQNQLRFLIRYSDTRRLIVLFLSQIFFSISGKANELPFFTEYLSSGSRRPLTRSVASKFREVFIWHIYPKLARFL